MHQITNLRFADDVMLISKTLPRLKSMLEDVITEAKKRGLELHPDKTKILRNTVRRTGRCAARTVSASGMSIEVLSRDGAVKYFGKSITFHDPNLHEVKHRVNAAWRSFMKIKPELTNRSFSLRRRLELFNCAVAPTALYGCAAWPLTKKEENILRGAERRMLRMIMGGARQKTASGEIETWVQWVKRAT